MSAPVLGQTVLIKIQLSPLREVPLEVTLVHDEDTVNGVALIDGPDDWPTNGPTTHPTLWFEEVTRGTGLHQWREAEVPGTIEEAITAATAAYATEVYVDNAAATRMSVPGGSSSAGLTLNGAGVQLSATRPCWLVVRGTASMASTLLNGQSYTVELRVDSSSTPTTVVDDDQGSLSGVLATDVDGWKLCAFVPAGHYARVVGSGTATLALTGDRKWVL